MTQMNAPQFSRAGTADYVRATDGGEPPAAHLSPEKKTIGVKAVA
jgi:hypothetical protein